jgi:hypothetical protein
VIDDAERAKRSSPVVDTRHAPMPRQAERGREDLIVHHETGSCSSAACGLDADLADPNWAMRRLIRDFRQTVAREMCPLGSTKYYSAMHMLPSFLERCLASAFVIVVIAAGTGACKSSSPSHPLDAPAGTSGGSNAGTSGMSSGAAGRQSSAGASGRGGAGASGQSGGGASGRGGAGASGRGSAGAGGAVGAAGAAAGSGGAVISEWRSASLTNFTSYPDPGSEECIEFNGCMWEGQFAGLDGKQTEEWVMSHNIVAVHSKDFDTYKLKTLRLRKDGKQIDVTVYDECSDSDCSGCCTQNAKPSGFLIDVEHYTSQRFGVSDGQVEWACLDCN